MFYCLAPSESNCMYVKIYPIFENGCPSCVFYCREIENAHAVFTSWESMCTSRKDGAKMQACIEEIPYDRVETYMLFLRHGKICA